MMINAAVWEYIYSPPLYTTDSKLIFFFWTVLCSKIVGVDCRADNGGIRRFEKSLWEFEGLLER